MCVAQDAEALGVLKRATVSAEWELAPGATDEDGVRQLHAERPHVVVVFGPSASGGARSSVSVRPGNLRSRDTRSRRLGSAEDP
jgi:hypothetical protein